MMKLSEAMRVGAKLRAASEEGWNDLGPDGNFRSCALSAAAEGAGLFTAVGNTLVPGPNWIKPSPESGDQRLGKPVEGNISSRMPDEWITVASLIEVPPCACKKYGISDQVMILIWHLHDIHKYSREAVAEWIETLEKELERKASKSEARRREIAKDLEIEP